MFKISKSSWFTIFTFAIGFMLPALGFLFPETFFSNREEISEFIKNFGWWSPVFFVAVSIIPIIFTPLNHGIFAIVGGFVFGPWIGFLLNWISKSLGTLITFSIGKLIGKKAIRKFAKSEDIKEYNNIFSQHVFLVFVGFMINDTLSYLAGISSMKTKTFIPLILLAHIIPTLTLAYVGSGISLKDPLFFILISSIALLIVFYFYIKKR